MHECAQVGVFPGHFPEIIIYIAVGERYFCVRMTHDSPARNSFRSVWRAMPRRFNAGWFGTHTEWGNGRYHSHYYVCTLCVLGRRRNHEHLRLLVLYTNKKMYVHQELYQSRKKINYETHHQHCNGNIRRELHL